MKTKEVLAVTSAFTCQIVKIIINSISNSFYFGLITQFYFDFLPYCSILLWYLALLISLTLILALLLNFSLISCLTTQIYGRAQPVRLFLKRFGQIISCVLHGIICPTISKNTMAGLLKFYPKFGLFLALAKSLLK